MRTYIIVFILVLIPAANGAPFSYRDDCPIISGKTTWSKYITPTNSGGALFSINFYFFGKDSVPKLGWSEPRWAGDILSGSIYNISMDQTKFHSSGAIKSRQCLSYSEELINKNKNNEIRLLGQNLKFDNNGFVYAKGVGWDGGFGLVGELSCHWSVLIASKKYSPKKFMRVGKLFKNIQLPTCFKKYGKH